MTVDFHGAMIDENSCNHNIKQGRKRTTNQSWFATDNQTKLFQVSSHNNIQLSTMEFPEQHCSRYSLGIHKMVPRKRVSWFCLEEAGVGLMITGPFCSSIIWWVAWWYDTCMWMETGLEAHLYKSNCSEIYWAIWSVGHHPMEDHLLGTMFVDFFQQLIPHTSSRKLLACKSRS